MADSSSSRQDLNSCKCEVFINFRGKDTRKGFVSYLRDALKRKGIEAYKDDVNLPRGEEISRALVKAIEDLKISVVVFSKKYATSRWCLEELVHILRCKRENKQIVLPVFYGVDPSHVRNQKGSYASAFVAHEIRFRDDLTKVNKWRSALKEAGNLSGWDSRTAGSEPEFLEEIVQDILQKLSSMSPTKGDELESKLVGVEDRLKKIEELLCFDSPDVRIVGIWGMGGIGKTALAEEIKKRFASGFESCFFEDVSEGVKRCGLEDFKKSLFAILLNDKNVDMNSSFNKVRLQRRKVLVVLDNVDNLRRLVSLIGEFPQNKSQFGKESKILITSRDTESFQADATYKVDALDSDNAFKLFYQHAFRTDPSKIPDYAKLSESLVKYAGGNPLALTVLGSHLHSRRFEEWECVLSKLREAPPKEIYDVLKISYDTLDRGQQSAFLDIAYFRKCWGLMSVIKILEDDYYCIDINILIEKCLIARRDGRLWMHDLMQEMAWEIMRQESTELEQRSRLWTPEDVSRVLEANKGSAKIQAIYFDNRKITSHVYLEPTIFGKMCNLRFLNILGVPFRYELIFDQGLGSLPDTLRYLIWRFYPLKSLPSNFRPQNLVILEMRFSKLTKLWDGVKHLGNLKHLDLSISHELIELPDLSHASKLETINLNCCVSLRRLPKMPMNLKWLDINYTAIKELGTSLQSLKKLERLELTRCEHLESLPNNCFPCSIQDIYVEGCISLKMINICGCESLKTLVAIHCNSLEVIDVSGCTSLQLKNIGVKNCQLLKYLNLTNIESIRSISVIQCTSLTEFSASGRTSLKRIDASGCTSLNSFRVSGFMSPRELYANGCKSFKKFIYIDEHGSNAWVTNASECAQFTFAGCLELEQSARDNIFILFQSWTFGLAVAFHLEYGFRPSISYFNGTDALRYNPSFASACYVGDVIPKWFSHQSKGSLITITLPQGWYNTNFIGFAASVVFGFENASTSRRFSYPNIACSIYLKTHCGSKLKRCIAYCPLTSFSFEKITQEWYSKDHVLMWHAYTYSFSDYEESTINNAVEASFVFFFDFKKEKEDDKDDTKDEEEDDEEEVEDHKEDKEDDNDDSFNEEIKAIVKRCGIRMMYLQEAEGFGFSSVERHIVSKKVDLSIKAISPSHEKDSMTSVRGTSKKK